MRTKLLSLLLILVVLTVPATSISKTFNSTYHWNNALDHSGVTWDGIQDHADQPTLQQGYQYGSLTEGLVGYWSFEQKRPKGPADRALGNNGTFKGDNDGTLNNFEFNAESGWTEEAKRGSNALEFDGVDDGVDLNTIWDTSTVFSASFWFYAEGDSTQRPIFDQNNLWSPIWNRNNEKEINIGTYGDNVDLARGISTGEWHHAYIEWDVSNEYMLGYLDGSKTLDTSYTDGAQSTSGVAAIGSGTGGLNRFNGKLDDLKAYSRSLSSSEISDLYNGHDVNRSGLVGEWTFDTGSGTTAHDTSNWKNGKLGRYSGEFDGSDDYLTLANESSVFQKPFTVSAWINPDSVSGRTYIYFEGGSSRPPLGYLSVEDGQIFSFYQDDSGSNKGITTGSVGTDRWQQITLTVSKGGSASVYKNGDLSGTTTFPTGSSYTTDLIGIGKDMIDDTGYFNGRIDSLRTYDRALSTQEVKALYDRNDREQRISPQDTLQSGLVGWWPLHETSGSTAADLSGNSNHGTLYGGDGPTQGVTGVGGTTAYSFDGSDDFIRLEEPADSIDTVEPITVSAWLRKDSETGGKEAVSYSGSRWSLSYDRFGSKGWEWRTYDGGSEHKIASDIETVGEWLHLVGIHNGSEMRFYINNKFVGRTPSDKIEQKDSEGLYIGARPTNVDPEKNFDGDISNVRIYDRALSNREIDRLYRMGSGDYATPPGDNEGGVAYWSFDQADSDTRVVRDEWGNHDGVRGNQSVWTQPSVVERGKRSKALKFDNTDDAVQVDDEGIPSGSPGDKISFSAWVNPESTISESILSNYDEWEVNLENSGEIWLRTSGGNNGGTDRVVGTDRWSHVAVIWNAGSNALIFHNGELIQEVSISDTSPDNGNPYWIGAEDTNFNGDPDRNFFHGRIDEVRIYNRSLAKHEVHELYQHGTFGRDMRSLTENRGLVGYWSLDENSGQTVYDLSGHGNNGNLGSTSSSDSSDPTQGEGGILGTTSYSFDTGSGAEEFVNVAHSKSLRFDDEISVSAWINADRNMASMGNAFPSVLKKDGGGCSNTFFLGSLASSTNKLGFRLLDETCSSSTEHQVSLNYDEDNWHLITGTYDGSKMSLYLDGELKDTHNADFKINNAGSNDLRIGHKWEGNVDEVRIYNRSLTPAEVQSLYSTSQHGSITNEWDAGGPVKPDLYSTDWNRPDAPGTSDLVGAWRLNEDHGLSSSGDTTSDWSGNENDGTTEGGITTHVDGAFEGSKAYEFDGVDDYVSVSDSPSLDIDAPFSTSTWVKLDENSSDHGFVMKNRQYYLWFDNGDGGVRLEMNNGGDWKGVIDSSQANPVPLSPNEWHHIVGWYDGSEIRIYKDGEIATSGSLSTTVQDTSNSLYIGAAEDRNSRYTDGKIDDVRIYDTALSKSSIKSLYHTSTVSADVIGGQGTEYGSRFGREFPFSDGYEAGPGAYEVSWERPHSETMLNTVLSTPNITKAPSLSAAALNASKYTETTTDQWNKGYKEGVASYRQGQYTGNQDGEIRLGQGRRSDSSLKAHYNFEPKNPGTVTDVSGNQNNGELIGNQKDGTLQNFDFNANSGWVSGKRGEHALKFDGNDDSVKVPDSSELNPTDEVTVTAWIKPKSPSAGDERIVDKSNKGGGYSLYLANRDRNGDGSAELYLAGKIGDGGNNFRNTQNPRLAPDKWHFAAITAVSNQKFTLWLDDTKIHEENIGSMQAYTGALGIGESGFNGIIDEARVYDRFLSPTEISDIYHGSEPNRSGLVGEWTFDEGSGTVAHDTSKWTSGVRQGKALEFDGSNDYVDLKAPLYPNGEKTMVTWFKYESGGLDNGDDAYLFEQEGSSGNIQAFYYNDDTEMVFRNNGKNTIAYDVTIEPGNWRHVAYTYDGSSKERLYLDGELASTSSGGEDTDDANDMGLGTKRLGGGLWAGTMDEARLYSRALTPHEVSRLYNPSPSYWSSSFFGTGGKTKFTNLTWQEDLQQSTDVEARVQVADRVEVADYSDVGTQSNPGKTCLDIMRKKPSADSGTYWIEPAAYQHGPIRTYCDMETDGGGWTLIASNHEEDNTIPSGTSRRSDDYHVNRPSKNRPLISDSDTVRPNVDYIMGPAVDEFPWRTVRVVGWGRKETGEDKTYREGYIEDQSNWVRTQWSVDLTGSRRLTETVGRSDLDVLETSEDTSLYSNAKHFAADGMKADEYNDGYDCNENQCTIGGVGTDELSGGRAEPGDGTWWGHGSNEGSSHDGEGWYDSSGNNGDSEGYTTWVREEPIEAHTELSEWMNWEPQHYDGPEPVSRWEFSRGAGQTVKDIEGDSDGTLGGGNGYGSEDPTWNRDCRMDGCMEFDGSDDYVALDKYYNSNDIDPFTVSAWVKVPENGGDWSIVDFDRSEYYSLSAGVPQGSKSGEGNYVTFHSRGGGGGDLWSNTPVRDGTWHHITWVADDDKKYIYIDGKKDVSQSASSIGTGVTRYGFLGDGSEASSFDGGRNNIYYEGSMDDVRIYDTSLTGKEIRSAMTSPKQPFASWQSRGGQDLKPLAHWTFDAGTGQKAYDSVGSNDGTLGGTTSVENSDPTWKSDCRYRGCLEFDGSDDSVTGSIEGAPTGAQERTLSLWIKPEAPDDKGGVFNYGSASKNKVFGILETNSGEWVYQLWGGQYDNNTGVFTDNGVWHHHTLVFNGTAGNYYYDGSLKHSSSAINPDTTGTKFIVGGERDGDDHWEGSVDDVRIYNRSLSDSSIHALYNAPSSSWSTSSVQVRTSAADPEDEDLVGAWSFEDVGQTVVDSSGEGNHGVLERREVIKSYENTGTHNWEVPGNIEEADILIVGGGGGGGSDGGGGGGAGGIVYKEDYKLDQGTYNINVGAGGSGDAVPDDGVNAENGENSNFGTLKALGGGGGASWNSGSGNDGSGGGSGGGAAGNTDGNIGGSGTQDTSVDGGFGKNGGDSNNDRGGGGGGGAGAAGEDSPNSNDGGKGGDGKYYGDIFGDQYGENGWFAGGGGGGDQNSGSEGADGGKGGGADSTSENTAPSGMPNTGGGGAGSSGSGTHDGGDGGSGIVLIRYKSQPPERVSGYSGQGLKFDGASDYVETDYTEEPSDITISSWVKPASADDVDGIVGRIDDNGDNEDCYLGTRDTGTWEFTCQMNPGGSDDWRDTNSDIVPNIGEWVHLAGRYDSSDEKLAIFVNGTLQSEVDAPAPLHPTNNAAYQIGRWEYNDPNEGYFEGKIDEVNIYSEALPNSEIRNLYRVSDFTPASRFNQGSYFNPNTTTLEGEEFDSQSLQYKVNMLSGDSRSVPSVDKVSVAQASGWTGFSSDDNGSGLNLPDSRFGQVQLRLSSDNPKNSPAVEDISLHTEPEGTDWLCSAPETGDWVIDRNCTFTGEQDAPGNVKVPSPHEVNITSDGLLGINLREFHLLIESKAKVLIDKLGSVQRVSFPEDCQAVLEENPSASSGTYKIDPDGEGGGKPFEVYCDMETDGGGWTLVVHYGSKNQDSQQYSVSGATNDLELYYGNVCGSDKSTSCTSSSHQTDGPTLSRFGNLNLRSQYMPKDFYSEARVVSPEQDGPTREYTFSLGEESFDTPNDLRKFTTADNNRYWTSHLGPKSYTTFSHHYSCGRFKFESDNHGNIGYCKAGSNNRLSGDPAGAADDGGDDFGTLIGLSLWDNEAYIESGTDGDNYQDGDNFKLYVR